MASRLGTWLRQLTIFPEVPVNPPAEENCRIGPNDTISLIALLSEGHDRHLLTQIARRHQWQLRFADDWSEGVELLREYKTGVAVIDHHLLGSTWNSSLQAFLGTPQSFCVLLTSADTTDEFWEEAIRVGIYDVLSTPLEEAATVETVRFAWMFWRSCVARACGASK